MAKHSNEVAILLAALSDNDETNTAVAIMNEMTEMELHKLSVASKQVYFLTSLVTRKRKWAGE